MSRSGRKLTVATCQFPVSPDVRRNARHVRRLIAEAKTCRAHVAHFSECALSGYGGAEIPHWRGYDWGLLRRETESVLELARRRRIWVVLGSSHRLSGRRRPHNALYVIDDTGRIVDRYDKRFCTSGDLRHYAPGDHFAAFTVRGVRCGLLICYDVRFPELYRRYGRMGVECIFQSFHNRRDLPGPSIHTTIMRPTLQARAASNYLWISATNTSRRYQSWPSVFVRPDGVIAASCRRHRTGMVVQTVEADAMLYDAAGAANRRRAARGVLHTGRPVEDPRSSDRKSL